MRKKRTNWTEQKIAVLIQLYPIETTPRTAEVLGMCERAVKEKARSLGLKKAVKSRWMEHADYVRNHFAHRSYAEIGKELGISREYARRIAVRMGLKRTALEDFKVLLREGADKISINSSAINNPRLISDAADKFGSQCVVVAIDAGKRADGSGWNIYKNGGRIDVGMDAVEWAMQADRLGAGEILLTSMDCDGTKAGYDIELTRQITENVSIPVIASGGAGTKEHFYEALTDGKADAALAASLFHYKELEIMDLKNYLADKGVPVRR